MNQVVPNQAPEKVQRLVFVKYLLESGRIVEWGTPHEDECTEAGLHSSLSLTSHGYHGCKFKRREWKRKLLQGANFHYTQANMLVLVPGLRLHVPLNLYPQSIWIQGVLSHTGQSILMNASIVARRMI